MQDNFRHKDDSPRVLLRVCSWARIRFEFTEQDELRTERERGEGRAETGECERDGVRSGRRVEASGSQMFFILELKLNDYSTIW